MDWLLDWVKSCTMLYLESNITLEFRHILSICYNLDMQFLKLKKPLSFSLILMKLICSCTQKTKKKYQNNKTK